MSNRLSVLALLGGTFVLYPMQQALAGCVPDGTAGADVIVCDNAPNDVNGVDAGADNDTVTVNSDATVSNSGADAIGTGGGTDTVTNNGIVSTSGDNASGIHDPDGGDLLYNAATGTILTTGTFSFGIEVDGDFAIVSNAGTITTLGIAGDAINVYGDSNSIDNSGTLGTSGVDASGVYVVGDSNNVDNNGSIATTGDTAEAISINGNSNHIDNYSTITTTGDFADGISASGDSNLLHNLSGGTITTSGYGAHGMVASGNGNTVRNYSTSTITTGGAFANGLFAVGDTNTVDNDGTITTTGTNAAGVAVYGNTNTADNSGSITTSGDYSIGISASGGDNNLINNDGTGTISTSGLDADGIRLVGDDTLNGPEEAITNSGSISTSGDDADGISLTGNSSEIYNYGSITTTGGVGGVDTLFGADGIEVDGNGNTVLNSGGSISTSGTDAEGIRVSGDSNFVTNAISSTISTSGSLAEGILVEGSGNVVTNAGSVTTTGSSSDGIATAGDSNTVTNSGTVSVGGTIFGPGSDGVSLGGTGDSLTNTGTITNTYIYGGSGVAVRGGDGGVSITNTGGTISSNTATAILTGSGADTVISSGNISAGSTAINTGAGADAVTLTGNIDISGDVIGGDDTDALTLNGVGTHGDLYGDVSGFESLDKDESGLWHIFGSATVGTANINAGELGIFGGTLSATTGGTTIALGAELSLFSGSSIAGDVTNSGTLDTTSNYATVFIASDYTQTATGTLEMVTGVTTTPTDVQVSGAVSLDGTVNVTFQDEGNISFGNSTYNIVSGTSRTGTFATENVFGLTDPTLTWGVDYDAFSAFLFVNRATDFLGTLSGLNEVQTALGRHLDNTTGSGDVTPGLGALLVDVVGLSDDGQKTFLQTASTGTHDDVSQAARSTTRGFGGTIKERMNLTRMTGGVGTAQQASVRGLQVAALGSQPGLVARESGGPALWAAGFGGKLDVDQDSNSGGRQGLESRLWGATLGVDIPFGDSGLMGIAGGYGSQNVDLNSRGGDADIDSKFGAIYAGWYPAPFYMEATASYARHDYDETRKIYLGPSTFTANSDHDGDQGVLNLEMGYTAMAGEHYQLNPYAALEYSRLDEDGYREGGAGELNQIIKSRVTDSLRSELGAQFDHVAGSLMNMGEVYTYARLSWVHDFEIDDRNLVASLQGTPGVYFGLDGRNLNQDGVRLGTGMTWLARSDWSVGLNFGGEWRGDETAYGAMVQVSKTLR